MIYQVQHLTDPDQSITVEGLSVGPNYPATMGFRLIAGHLFYAGVEADTSRPVIVNETSLRELGVEGADRELLSRQLETENIPGVCHK